MKTRAKSKNVQVNFKTILYLLIYQLFQVLTVGDGDFRSEPRVVSRVISSEPQPQHIASGLVAQQLELLTPVPTETPGARGVDVTKPARADGV